MASNAFFNTSMNGSPLVNDPSLMDLQEDDILDEFLDKEIYHTPYAASQHSQGPQEDAYFTNFINSDYLVAPDDKVQLDDWNFKQESPRFLGSAQHAAPPTMQQMIDQSANYKNSIVSIPQHSDDITLFDVSKRILQDQLKFGRVKPINTLYESPSDYLTLDAAKLPYKMSVADIPSHSRVETQIKISIDISPSPPEFLVHLPVDSITKQKLHLEEDINMYPLEILEKMLFLESFVLCASTMRPAAVCTRCIRREQRRASRRKSGLSDNVNWCNSENKRAIVFNSKEVFLLKLEDCFEDKKHLQLSSRIVCYCRHHQEAKGFQVFFVLKNYKGEVLAKALSTTIMIMDKKPANGEESATSKTDISTATSVTSASEADIPAAGVPIMSPTSIDDESSEALTTDSKKKKRMWTPPVMANKQFEGARQLHRTESERSLSQISMLSRGSIPNLQFAQETPRPVIQRVIPNQGPIRGGVEVTLLGNNFKPGMIVKFGANKALATHCWSDSTIVTFLPPSQTAGQVLVTVTEDETQDLPGDPKSIFTYLDDTDRNLIELALQIVGLKMNGKLEDARNIAKRIVGSDTSAASSPASNQSPGGGQYQSPGGAQYQSPIYYSDENLILKVMSMLNNSANLNVCTEEGQTLLHLSALKGYFRLCSELVKKGARVDSVDVNNFTPLHFACINGDYKIIRLLTQCKADIHMKGKNGVTPREMYVINNSDNEHFDEILDMLSDYDESSDVSYPLVRKSSVSSVSSSVFEEEIVNSHDVSFQVQVSRLATESVSEEEDFEFESSEYEQELEEEEDNVSEEKPDLAHTDSSLWNRVRNVFQTEDPLPSYDELFPGTKKTVSSAIKTITNAVQSATNSYTDIEDEEEAVQAKLNRFFQQRTNFQQDKMLLFFWLPLMIIMLSMFTFFSLGSQSTMNEYSAKGTQLVRDFFTKLMIGYERFTPAVKEQIHHFHQGIIAHGAA